MTQSKGYVGPRPSRPYKSKTTQSQAEYEEKRTQARALFLMGMSYRDIAARVGLSENGYVTIARWVEKYGWKAEREELEREQKESRRQTYLHRVSTIQDAHLRLAEKVRRAAELALEGYIEQDENGEVVGVKVNPKTGLPAIGPYAIQQLIATATDLERKALGVELLPTEEVEQLSGPTIDATPLDVGQQELLRRMGDYLAQQTLLPATGPVVASDTGLTPGPIARADTPQETTAPDTPPAP